MEPVVNFYHPDGRWLFGYTVRGTFAGERENTIALLAAENGVKPEEITARVETKATWKKRREGKK